MNAVVLSEQQTRLQIQINQQKCRYNLEIQMHIYKYGKALTAFTTKARKLTHSTVGNRDTVSL